MTVVAEISELARPTSAVLNSRAVIIQKAKPRAAWRPELRIKYSELRTKWSVQSRRYRDRPGMARWCHALGAVNSRDLGVMCVADRQLPRVPQRYLMTNGALGPFLRCIQHRPRLSALWRSHSNW